MVIVSHSLRSVEPGLRRENKNTAAKSDGVWKISESIPWITTFVGMTWDYFITV